MYSMAQNPFDIKTPAKNNLPKNQPTAPAQPPKEENKKETIVPKPQLQVVIPASQNTQNPVKRSTNPFEIIPGGTAPTLINPTGSVISPNENQINTSQTGVINNPPSNQVNKQESVKKTNGLESVNNPFNIKPGESNVGAQNDNIIIASPDLKGIKEQLNEFKIKSLEPTGNISKNMWFVIYIFLFLLAAIAINFNRSYPIALLKATYNQNQLRILFKDAFKGNHSFIFIILYFIFIINAGIFLYFSFYIFQLGSISLIQSILLVFGVYVIRHLVLFIMGIAFPMSKEANLFSYTIGMYNLALGLALLFINILLSFVDVETGKMLIFSGISIIGFLYLMRQVRGFLNNVPTIASGKFHFIIYLCTVEIAPWLLLAGILSK